jgi:hypothetical protein
VDASTGAFQHIPYGNDTSRIKLTVELYDKSIRRFMQNNSSKFISKDFIDPIFYYKRLDPIVERIDPKYPLGSVLNVSHEDHRDLVDRLISITQEFSFETVFIHPITYELGCVRWKVFKHYDFSMMHGSIPLNFHYTYSHCRHKVDAPFRKITTYLQIGVVIISLISLCFNLFNLSFFIYLFLKKLKEKTTKFKNIGEYLQYWYFVSLFANILNIIGSTILLTAAQTEATVIVGLLFVGSGAYFTMVSALRNYFHFPRLYVFLFIAKFSFLFKLCKLDFQELLELELGHFLSFLVMRWLVPFGLVISQEFLRH